MNITVLILTLVKNILHHKTSVAGEIQEPLEFLLRGVVLGEVNTILETPETYLSDVHLFEFNLGGHIF